MQIPWFSKWRSAIAFSFLVTLSAAGAQARDMDSDGIPDASDNCPFAGNAMQVDGDYDGLGNRCDPDFNNDGVVDEADLDYLKSVFFESDIVGDLNASGLVDFADLAILKRYYGAAPGTPPALSGREGGRAGGGTDGIVSLLPGQTDVFDGDELTLDLHIDFTADPTVGGGVDLLYDDTLLQFESWQAADVGDPAFSRPPDVEAGALRGIAVGDFDGLTGPVVIGTVTFTALDIGDTTVEPSETALVGVGPFVSATDFAAQEVDYLSADVGITLTPGPRIVVEPLEIDLGSIAPFEVSTGTVTITNVGDLDLTIGAVGAVDDLAPPFSLSIDGCSGQLLLPAGQCTLEVEFAPEGVSNYLDTFDIPSNALDFPNVSVTVTGSTSMTPVIEVLPPARLFDNIPVGGSTLEDFAILNAGGAPLEVGTIDASGLDTPFRFESDPCSNTVLQPGGVCLIVVRYSPMEPDVMATANLVIPSNDPIRPTVNVEMTGFPAPGVDTDVFGNNSGLGSIFHTVACINRTSGQAVTDSLPVIKGWNCRELGLEANEGDAIEIYILGVAE
ncbi:MAG: choice-of-anchor D domain-containing protein [Pseudomonadota bacterium]